MKRWNRQYYCQRWGQKTLNWRHHWTAKDFKEAIVVNRRHAYNMRKFSGHGFKLGDIALFDSRRQYRIR